MTAGQTVSGIDATLAAGATITGTVTDALSGANLGSICVFAYQNIDDDFGSTCITASDGTYSIRGLPAGTYSVEFFNCGNSESYLTQWYHNETSAGLATPLSITAGSNDSSRSTR